MNLKIAQKFYMLSTVFLLFITAMVVYTFMVLASQEKDGVVINLAGKQRMLSQKLAKEALGVSSGKVKPSELISTAKLFDKTLNGLLFGDPDLGLPKTEEKHIVEQLFKVKDLWGPFYKKVMVIASSPTYAEKQNAIKFIMDNNIPLLKEMNKAVKLYEEATVGNVQGLKSFQVVFLVLSVIVMGFVLLFIDKKIVKPVKSISSAAHEVIKGNLDVEVEIKSRDELGILGSDFNKMVASIKKTRSALLKEKSEVEEKIAQATKDIEENRRYLDRNTEKMLKAMQRFAQGDLTVSLKPERSNDNICRLFKGFNQAVENIKFLILEVYDAVEATASASVQISSNIEEIANGTQQQNGQTAEVASAVDQMTSSILETNNFAEEASRASRQAGEIASTGGEVVLETIEGMDKIAKVVEKSAKSIEELGEGSNQIGEIIQVINEIAEQTNLLALNAAIEAARAGEQGRGFAVVADEVRKLAERTTNATTQIEDMIKQIQKDTNEAVSSIKEGEAEVERGKEKANVAGESLNNIIDSVKKTVELVSQVADANKEQAETAEKISSNIEIISNVTNQTNLGVQQIVEAVDDLSRLTLNLKSKLERFYIKEIEGDRKNEESNPLEPEEQTVAV